MNKLYEEDSIKSIADEIRNKTKSKDEYTVSEMAQAIKNMKVGNINDNMKVGIINDKVLVGVICADSIKDSITVKDYEA